MMTREYVYILSPAQVINVFDMFCFSFTNTKSYLPTLETLPVSGGVRRETEDAEC